jgi:hypothetical protein
LAVTIGAALLIVAGPALVHPAHGQARSEPSKSTRGSAPTGLGRCHMEACSWTRIESERLVRQRGKYRLIKVSLTSGRSEHPDGSYPGEYSPGIRIEWNAERHELHVLCAAEMPAVIERSKRGYEISVLDFDGGLFGYQMGAEGIYAHACHGEWMTAAQLQELYLPPSLELPARLGSPAAVFEHIPDDQIPK